ARVIQAAAELGYALPVNYRTHRTGVDGLLQQVGVLIETPAVDRPAPYLTGMSEAAMNLDASLIIHYTKPENASRILERKYQPQALRSGLLDGLILVFRWPPEVVSQLHRMLP